jgi:hypothetical protein
LASLEAWAGPAVPKFYETVLYITSAQMAELYQNLGMLQQIAHITTIDSCRTKITPDCKVVLGGTKTLLIFYVQDGGHHPTGNSYQFVDSERKLGDIDLWKALVADTLGRDSVSEMLVGADSEGVPYDRGFLIEVPQPTPGYVSIVRFHTFEYEPDYLQMTYPDAPEDWGIRRDQIIGAKGLHDPGLPLVDYVRSVSRLRPEQITRYTQAMQALGMAVLRSDENVTEMTDGDFLFDLEPTTAAAPLEGTEHMFFNVTPGSAWNLKTSFFAAQAASGASELTIDFDLGAFQP